MVAIKHKTYWIEFIKDYRGPQTNEFYHVIGDTAEFDKRTAHALVDAGYATHLTKMTPKRMAAQEAELQNNEDEVEKFSDITENRKVLKSKKVKK